MITKVIGKRKRNWATASVGHNVSVPKLVHNPTIGVRTFRQITTWGNWLGAEDYRTRAISRLEALEGHDEEVHVAFLVQELYEGGVAPEVRAELRFQGDLAEVSTVLGGC